MLRALRAAHIETPVLVLSALASVGDRIEGLESGSDDYLVKPFSFAELLARVNALLRRREARLDPADHRLTVGDLEIEPLSRTVKRGGRKIDLKPREYLLLEYFARNEGRVVTRTMLLEQVWDYHFDPAPTSSTSMSAASGASSRTDSTSHCFIRCEARAICSRPEPLDHHFADRAPRGLARAGVESRRARLHLPAHA